METVRPEDQSPLETSSTLINRAVIGDLAALGKLLLQCESYLLQIANQELNRSLRSKGDALDLVQQTHLEAIRDFKKFTGETEEELLAWLRRLLLNNLRDFEKRYKGTRRRSVEREPFLLSAASHQRLLNSLTSADPTASTVAMSREMRACFDTALRSLPEHYQEVMILRYRDNFEFAVIGDQLKLSDDGARKLCERAIQKFEREFRRLWPHPLS